MQWNTMERDQGVGRRRRTERKEGKERSNPPAFWKSLKQGTEHIFCFCFLILSYFYYIIVVLGVLCDIYKCAYNVF
jgi:hypothetical protein